jgi:hypothetical protein
VGVRLTSILESPPTAIDSKLGAVGAATFRVLAQARSVFPAREVAAPRGRPKKGG